MKVCLKMVLPTFPRLHWCGEGCNRVYSQSRAALHLSDHLCRQTALNHHVCTQKQFDRFLTSSFIALLVLKLL